VLALSALSLPTLVLAFAGDSVMEILFLIEHSLMVVVGLALNKRLITIWGAVCVTLALIYLLSGFVVVKAIKPRSIVSKGLKLCEVKISCPLPFSDKILNSSPSRYSKIPESNSSMAIVIEDTLYIMMKS